MTLETFIAELELHLHSFASVVHTDGLSLSRIRLWD